MIYNEDNINIDGLYDIFDSALFNVKKGSDELLVVERFNVLICIENNNQINFYALFNAVDDISESDLLIAINKLNKFIYFLKFSLGDEKTIRADYDLSVLGGVSGRYIASCLKQFIRALELVSTDDELIAIFK